VSVVAIDGSLILLLPGVAAAVLLVFVAYVGLLFIRCRLAQGRQQFEKAILLEEKLASLLHWRSFSGPRLADLYLLAGRDDPDAFDLYTATLSQMPDPKVAASRMSALLRTEDLKTHFDLCRRVFIRLYEENVRTPHVWEMCKEIASIEGDDRKTVAILHEWMDELPNRKVCLELRDIYLPGDTSDERAEEIFRKSLGFEGDHRPTIDKLYAIFSDRWDTSDEALFLYRKVLQLEPEREWANSAVAEILSRQGEKREIIPLLVKGNETERALAAIFDLFGPNPDDVWALGWMCEIVMRQNNRDAHALGICHRYVASGGDSPAPLSFLFRVYSDQRDRSPDALAVFESYRRAHIEDIEGLRALAKAYRDTGRVRDAVWLLEEGLEEFPGDLKLIKDLARTFLREGMRSEKALLRMTEYIEYEWDEEVASFLRDVLLESEGDRSVTVRVLSCWLEHRPDDADVLRALARIHLEDRDTMDGIPLFRKLMDLGHEPPWVIRGLADLYSWSGDRGASAETIYTRAVNQGVAGDHVIVALAQVNHDQGRRDGFALEILRRAVGLPDCPVALKVALAAICFDMEMFHLTVSLSQEVLELEPSHLEAERWLGKALTRSGGDTHAYKTLQKVYAERPDDEGLLDELTEAYVLAGVSSVDAFGVYERYLKTRPAEDGGSDLVLDARKFYGLASFRSGEYAVGFATLKFLYEESPERAKSLVTAAEKCLGAARERERLLSMVLEFGDVGLARPLLIAHAKAYPDRVDLLVGFLRKTRRDFVEALGQVMEVQEDLHAADLVTVRLLGEMASCHIFAGDMDMAARRWRELLDLTHDEEHEGPPLPFARGEARWPLLGTDVSRLLGRVLKLLKKGLRHGSVFFVAGRLFLRKDNPRKAAQYLAKARELAPGDQETAHFLKVAYRGTFERTGADEVREKLADVLAAEENWDEAIVEYQGIAGDYSQAQLVAVKISRCFMEKGHPTVAAREIEKTLEGEDVTRENLEVWYTLGVALKMAGRREEARLTFERIGFVDFNYRDVRRTLDEFSRSIVAAEQAIPSSGHLTIGDLATGEFDVSEMHHERFEIIEVCGRGGMASVFKAMDHEFDPPLLVALKILPEGVARNEKAVLLFKREAAATIKLNHPNIVRVYSTGEENGRRYISMEYIDGPDFASVIDRQGRLDPRLVVTYLRQILAGLGNAHSMGVFHKDIKPSNIMITHFSPEGVVKITDFGIARIVSDEIGRTKTLSIRGTLPYMSPQQVAGEPATAGDDIYSLGITLYEMLSGDPPFLRGDIAYQHAHKDPRPIQEVAPHIPPFLETIVMRCLDKDPARRYAGTHEILKQLQ
jgi:tetratricopeptide (TPR) repeat protein